jgi:hypothetical protein
MNYNRKYTVRKAFLNAELTCLSGLTLAFIVWAIYKVLQNWDKEYGTDGEYSGPAAWIMNPLTAASPYIVYGFIGVCLFVAALGAAGMIRLSIYSRRRKSAQRKSPYIRELS